MLRWPRYWVDCTFFRFSIRLWKWKQVVSFAAVKRRKTIFSPPFFVDLDVCCEIKSSRLSDKNGDSRTKKYHAFLFKKAFSGHDFVALNFVLLRVLSYQAWSQPQKHIEWWSFPMEWEEKKKPRRFPMSPEVLRAIHEAFWMNHWWSGRSFHCFADPWTQKFRTLRAIQTELGSVSVFPVCHLHFFTVC